MSKVTSTIRLLFPTHLLVVSAAVLLSLNPSFGAQLVTNEATRIDILRAVFPGTQISASRQNPLDWRASPWPGHELIDALAGEKEYEVVGNVDKSEEAWANGVLVQDLESAPHENRRLRFRVYEVSNGALKTYVALAHYTFTGIQFHPFCCEWFARLFFVSREGALWKVQYTHSSLLYRAKTIRSFRLIDLDGDGREEILVEAENTATAYRRWIAMNIFGIVDGALKILAEADTLSTNGEVTQYSRELDVARTRTAAGKSILFKTIVYGTENEPFPTPRIEEEGVMPSPKELR